MWRCFNIPTRYNKYLIAEPEKALLDWIYLIRQEGLPTPLDELQLQSDSGRITIIVSHRFSTVRMADLIVVLDGARLVEVGTHDELMAKRGQYSELYSIQAAAYR